MAIISIIAKAPANQESILQVMLVLGLTLAAGAIVSQKKVTKLD